MKALAMDPAAIFRAFKYRNFRLFFFGQGISLVGTWMQAVAMGWMAYRMTGSPFLLGLIGFFGQIPTFILSPIAGVMADRSNRRRILIVTQALEMAQALILAGLVLTGAIRVWHLVALSVFLGCVNAFDIPVRQSFIVEMVGRKDDIGNAIALNSMMFNAARLVGPSVAGLLIAITGEGLCFLLNGLSFIAVLASLFAMKVARRHIPDADVDVIEWIREGFHYAFGFAPIRYILLLLGTISFMGTSYVVLMPVFARDVLFGGASTLGFLMASAGLGAMAATIYLASRKNVLGLGRMIPAASSIFSIGMIAFAFSKVLWVSMVLLAIAGFGMMAHMAASNTILQTIVDDDKRGRVMSFYVIAFIGAAPFGSLLAGSLASRIGAANTLMMSGICSLGASLLFAGKLPVIRKKIHPIYRKMGIIPEVASGIGTAARLTMPPED